MLLIRVPQTFTNPDLDTLARDPLLKDAGGGVLFLFDLAFPYSWASGAAPADGDTVGDVSDHADGAVVKAASQTIGYAGGGFDYSSLTSILNTERNNHVKAPASVWADIDPVQHFMVATYMKLPANADWNTTGTVHPFFASGAVNPYTAEADPLMLDFGSGNLLGARRQTAIGAADVLSINAATGGHQGLFAQVAYWRNAAGSGLRVKSAAGTSLSTGAAGADNAEDFSTKQAKWGTLPYFADFTNAASRNSRKWRLYRGWIENLETSGRSPVDVLDADWTRTVARGVFS